MFAINPDCFGLFSLWHSKDFFPVDPGSKEAKLNVLWFNDVKQYNIKTFL